MNKTNLLYNTPWDSNVSNFIFKEFDRVTTTGEEMNSGYVFPNIYRDGYVVHRRHRGDPFFREIKEALKLKNFFRHKKMIKKAMENYQTLWPEMESDEIVKLYNGNEADYRL